MTITACPKCVLENGPTGRKDWLTAVEGDGARCKYHGLLSSAEIRRAIESIIERGESAQDSSRAEIARLALVFICATAPRSVEFAARKLRDLFGCADIGEDELRAAQQALLVESTQGLSTLLQKRRK